MNRFLIIEDNKLMAEVLSQIIRKCISPKEIIKVSNIASAQKLIIDSSYKIDAIFLDLNIEKPLDGLDLLSYIKRTLPNMPVSIITSENETEVVKKVLSHQPNDYLIKPLSVQKVQRSLAKFKANSGTVETGS
ncbi:transcriptional regulator [Photobacterium proteolyticum]|uniref:Transcriptional regulator n=1 Tax=Photobacterium proteolyticum TaxID=1903952 RepID=A0A1Q9G6T7_9GAMM|nr:response regulator [Photobacterium proteolyticum]OLQ70002.1 transcriptional regulator [Photobacterium proteolyticum]